MGKTTNKRNTNLEIRQLFLVLPKTLTIGATFLPNYRRYLFFPFQPC